jgi:hypothetical protein
MNQNKLALKTDLGLVEHIGVERINEINFKDKSLSVKKREKHFDYENKAFES